MLNKLFITTLSLFIVFSFIGCKQSQTPINSKYKKSKFSYFADEHFTDLDNAIIEISNQLLLNIDTNSYKNNKIVITSFVSLDEFTKTSSFGRMVAESLINELHSRRFKLIDFRATEAMTVNKNGEFILSRDIDRLKDEMPGALVLVGTYTKLDKNRLVINARIVNNHTSDVLSTARVVYEYDDCKPFDLCPKKEHIKKPIVKKFKILKDL